MQCATTPFWPRSAETASTISWVIWTMISESFRESGVGSEILKSASRRTVPSIRSITSSNRTASWWMSSRSIGVMNVRSIPRRTSCEISSHSCSSRLIWSATGATGASPPKKPFKMRALSWMRRAMSLKRTKNFSSRGNRMSIAPHLFPLPRKKGEDGIRRNGRHAIPPQIAAAGLLRVGTSALAVMAQSVEEHVQVDRLGNIAVGFEPQSVLLAIGLRGDHDNRDLRQVRVLPLFVAKLPAVHDRHHQVEEDHGRAGPSSQSAESLEAMAGAGDAIALRLENLG